MTLVRISAIPEPIAAPAADTNPEKIPVLVDPQTRHEVGDDSVAVEFLPRIQSIVEELGGRPADGLVHPPPEGVIGERCGRRSSLRNLCQMVARIPRVTVIDGSSTCRSRRHRTTPAGFVVGIVYGTLRRRLLDHVVQSVIGPVDGARERIDRLGYPVTSVSGVCDTALQCKAVLARNVVLRLEQPVQGVVGIVDHVAVAIGMTGAVAGRVVTVGIHLRKRVRAAGQSIASIVTIRGLVGLGVGHALQIADRVITNLVRPFGQTLVRIGNLGKPGQRIPEILVKLPSASTFETSRPAPSVLR
jgi:hypothetical protein